MSDEDRLRSRGGLRDQGHPGGAAPARTRVPGPAERQYAIGHFDGSPAIGPYKVYPKVQKFFGEKRLKSSAPVIELYTVTGEEITTEYLFAVDNAP